MAAKDDYLHFVLEQLAPLGKITSRPLFGGHAIYRDGVVFALVSRNTLFLKVDALTRERFESKGLAQFNPFEDPKAKMQYFAAPADIFESEDGLQLWAGLAIEAGQRAATKKTAKKVRTKVDHA